LLTINGRRLELPPEKTCQEWNSLEARLERLRAVSLVFQLKVFEISARLAAQL
jgi:hypothetical protein